MSEMTDRMSQAGGQTTLQRGEGNPKTGERFRCLTCGMEMQVTADCHCEDPGMVHFHCCGKQLQKV
jgi:hypothetical protein